MKHTIRDILPTNSPTLLTLPKAVSRCILGEPVVDAFETSLVVVVLVGDGGRRCNSSRTLEKKNLLLLVMMMLLLLLSKRGFILHHFD